VEFILLVTEAIPDDAWAHVSKYDHLHVIIPELVRVLPPSVGSAFHHGGYRPAEIVDVRFMVASVYLEPYKVTEIVLFVDCGQPMDRGARLAWR
jgi:hypothetical protein